MSDLQSSTQQHCFARLKARVLTDGNMAMRELTQNETNQISGAVSSDSITGVTAVEPKLVDGEKDGYTVTGEDHDND